MYEAGTATSVADLYSKLSTFAVAQGWTQDYSAADRLFLSRSTVFVSFRWDTATPANVGIYNATAFSGSGTAPGSHTGDSGQGVITSVNATFATGRFVGLDNDSNRYWFFEDDTYLHIVVEVATGDFRHFGFGILDKFGNNWTGGEYAYGQRNTTTAGTNSLAIQGDATNILDGLTNNSNVAFMASCKMSGIPSQAASIWGVVGGVITAPGTDRGGSARSKIFGGFRGGTAARTFGRIGSNNALGLVPLYPINLYANTNTTDLYLLGTMKDVRGVNIGSWIGGDEVVMGGETWTFFPARIKGEFNTSANTKYQGIAYKKVTT